MDNTTFPALPELNLTELPENKSSLYDLSWNITALSNDTVITSTVVLETEMVTDSTTINHGDVTTVQDIPLFHYTQDIIRSTTSGQSGVTTMVPFIEAVINQDLTTEETPEERTLAGLPLSLLWVPYVILSLVLTLLMIVSFIRFHKRNGHKYRRRRNLIWRQLNMSNILNQLQGGGRSGSATTPPNGGVITGKHASHSTKAKSPNKAQPSTSKTSSGGPRKNRRPLVFTTNLNGSMVDLRCGESDSLQTFRSKRNPPQNQNSASFWLLPPKRTPAPNRSQAEPDDDEVFLLHHPQTRL